MTRGPRADDADDAAGRWSDAIPGNVSEVEVGVARNKESPGCQVLLTSPSQNQGKRRKRRKNKSSRWVVVGAPCSARGSLTHSHQFHAFRLTECRTIGYSRVPTRMWHTPSLWRSCSPRSHPLLAQPHDQPSGRRSPSRLALEAGLCVVCFVYSRNRVFCKVIAQIALTTWSRSNQTPCRVTKVTRRRLAPVASGPLWSLTTVCQRLDDLLLPATTTTSRPITHQHALHDPSTLSTYARIFHDVYYAPLRKDQLMFSPHPQLTFSPSPHPTSLRGFSSLFVDRLDRCSTLCLVYQTGSGDPYHFCSLLLLRAELSCHSNLSFRALVLHRLIAPRHDAFSRRPLSHFPSKYITW
jgi:hypothetical protein